MIEEVRKRQTAGVTTRVVESGQRAVRGKVSVRRRAECPKRDLNRDINRQKMLVELLPLAKRVALKIPGPSPAAREAAGNILPPPSLMDVILMGDGERVLMLRLTTPQVRYSEAVAVYEMIPRSPAVGPLGTFNIPMPPRPL
jgi:hypothetical protein